MPRIKRSKRKSGIHRHFDEKKAEKILSLLGGKESSALDFESNVQDYFIILKIENMKFFWAGAPNSRSKLEEFMRIYGSELSHILKTNVKKKICTTYSSEKLIAQIERFLNLFKFKVLHEI